MEEMTKLGRVAVYVPDMKSVTNGTFKKPFILLGMLPLGARFLSVRSVPNLLDVMGMPSGGGPPGFSTLVLNRAVEKPPRLRLLAGFLPGADVTIMSDVLYMGDHVGTCVTIGIIVNYFEFFIKEEADGAPDVTNEKEVASFLEKNGYAAVPLAEYETPEVLLRGMSASAPGAPGS